MRMSGRAREDDDELADLNPTRRRPPAPTGRAGRDLPAAIGIGLLLAAMALGSLLLVKHLFVLLVLVVMALAVMELQRALAGADLQVPLVPVLVGGAIMLLLAYLRGAEALAMALVLTVVLLWWWRVADGVSGGLRDIAGGTLVAVYPSFLGGFAMLMLAAPDGDLRVIFFILVTVCSDIGGYAVGVLAGRHPIAPSVSPKKSWEGLAGSIALSGAVGAVAITAFFGVYWWVGAGIGAGAAILATMGDFIESSIKRDLGVKDMGTLLPGHGGVMDRLDSLVVTAPFVWAALLFFAPPL